MTEFETFAASVAQLFDTAPRDWWAFVSCGYCNSRRQEPCQQTEGPARAPHVHRVRVAQVLHGTLWLLREFPADVLGDDEPGPDLFGGEG